MIAHIEVEQVDREDADHGDERAGYDRDVPLQTENEHERGDADEQREAARCRRARPADPRALRRTRPRPSTPKSFGSWPTMTVSARPMTNPFNTGAEMKPARKPSRRAPATTARMPTTRANVIVSCTNSSALPAARSPTAAAESAAVAAVGPVTRWRELPKAAYRISAPGAAYRPTTGARPRRSLRTRVPPGPVRPTPSSRLRHRYVASQGRSRAPTERAGAS